ncbi:nitroreductase family protein [Candidatus Lokiarchaeum ossiferum]|uniref:nitroreductase family protein n=1 Tax=Candidatus Lokiarchaeum ossiferum TaxID=2951803 RepID=UPI00352F496A
MENETLNSIFTLKSTRKFAKKEIPCEFLDVVLNAALRAGNSGNRQVYSIVVIEDPKLLKKYFYGGNKALVFVIDFYRWLHLAKKLGYKIADSIDGLRGFTISSMDAMLAAQNAALAAQSLGIGSLFTTSLHREDMKEVYKILNLPTKYCFPYLSLCLGYSEEKEKPLKGRIKKGVIHYGSYSRLTSAEMDEIIAEHDDDNNNLGFVSEAQRIKEGYDHALSLYFDKWSKPQPVEEIRNFYQAIKESGFLEVDKFLS